MGEVRSLVLFARAHTHANLFLHLFLSLSVSLSPRLLARWPLAFYLSLSFAPSLSLLLLTTDALTPATHLLIIILTRSASSAMPTVTAAHLREVRIMEPHLLAVV